MATRFQGSRAPEPAPHPPAVSRPPGSTLSIAVPLPTGALARYHVAVGDREGALEMIEQTAASDPVALQTLVADPAFDPLRADARFADVLRRSKG